MTFRLMSVLFLAFLAFSGIYLDFVSDLDFSAVLISEFIEFIYFIFFLSYKKTHDTSS